MRSATGDLNHLGVTKAMKCSSVSYNNQHRYWELFQAMYFSLYNQFDSTLKNSRKLLHKRKIYLLDSTTIDLCLNVFEWTLFRKKKGAIKLHSGLYFDDCMPVFADLRDGKKHDVKAAHDMEFPSGSVVVADRAYVDFNWMRELNEQEVFYFIRGKENIKLELTERPLSPTDESNSHIQYDWVGYLSLPISKEKYPYKFRMVQIWDEEQQVYLELLNNNFNWTASTISELYKRRWSNESFFREIKTHMKIKSFIGTSMNAVLIQIWTALITILLLKTLQKEAKHPRHLSNLVSFIRLNLFVKIDLKKWLDKPFWDDDEIDKMELQFSYFKTRGD